MDISNSTVSLPPNGSDFYIPPPGPLATSSNGGNWPLSWRHLVDLEPRLEQLERFTKTAGPTERNWLQVKARLGCLVGFGAGAHAHDDLTGHRSYEIAYEHLRLVWEQAHAAGRRRRAAG